MPAFKKSPSFKDDPSARRILIIDDDVELCELITEFLAPEGFAIDSVHSGTKGFEQALAHEYSLLILDIMLPGTRGFEVLQKIRTISRVPIIMLTARNDQVDRILGLEIGADDYLPKPFNPRELAARINAVLRRTARPLPSESASSPERLTLGDIELDRGSLSVRRNSRELALTAVEFDLLTLFLRTPGTILKREDLARNILGRDLSPFDRSIDVHVSNLRRKLGPLPDGTDRIKAIRGTGYLYVLPEQFRGK